MSGGGAPRRPRRPPGIRFRERHDPVAEQRRPAFVRSAPGTAAALSFGFRVGQDPETVDHNVETLTHVLSMVTQQDPHTAITIAIGTAFLVLHSAECSPVETVRELLVAVEGVADALGVDFKAPAVPGGEA